MSLLSMLSVAGANFTAINQYLLVDGILRKQ